MRRKHFDFMSPLCYDEYNETNKTLRRKNKLKGVYLMNIKSLAIASIAVLASVAPAFAGASVTNTDVYRVSTGMSDVVGTTNVNSYKYENGTSAAIKLESEGYSYDSGYNCYYYGCYSYSNTSSGASINVSAGDDYWYYDGDAEVYGSASGSTVIGAASESSFSETTYTDTNINFFDWTDYVEVETTHTVSTDAF